MNTLRFEYLLDLEKTGNISRTAEDFFISPSAVSQCLKKEEAELGYPIFTYTEHRMVPTREGKLYLDGARRILAVKQETYEKLQISRKSHDRLRIAVTPLLYEMFHDRLLALSRGSQHGALPDTGKPQRAAAEHTVSFGASKRQDDIACQDDTAGITGNLSKPQETNRSANDDIDIFPAGSRVGTEYILSRFADLAITCSGSPHARASICKQVLRKDRLVLVVPREYLKGYVHTTPAIRDCETIPFILLKSTSLMRVIEEEILAKSHITAPRTYEVDDFAVGRNYLLEGRGASFLPAAFVPEEADKHFFIIEPVPARSIYYSILYLNTASARVRQIAENIAAGLL